MLSYYSKLSAEVYDLDKYVGRSFGDVEYYQERLADCKGPVLEPGAGNGRLLIPLLEKGFDVDGLDVSTDMLDICRHHCEKRGLETNLFTGRMESFSLEKRYEAIIIPTGSFLLLHQREDAVRALENFQKHLNKDGRLLIDIFLQKDVSLHTVSTRSWETANDELITLETKLVEVDYVHQYSLSHHRYEKWKKGALLETELELFPLRWFGVEEFRLLLLQHGFKDITISADYQYGQYPTNTSEIITFEARV
ncbi:class I SAM-dependent methyltransferase [Alkalicoccus daliensis]|uniref:Methyltransferase domain-containing protein n=1 Tax=Alkalicoccus daliensis TaxID=745820 RepID=A0A1H0CRB9_9BACI|nr:class I SAM-dependent methyltransferase [Alkalicoccus daliensis]SDN60375.1 Methyltransferase domain-containing protein [Alkalicoccus daliensis]